MQQKIIGDMVADIVQEHERLHQSTDGVIGSTVEARRAFIREVVRVSKGLTSYALEQRTFDLDEMIDRKKGWSITRWWERQNMMRSLEARDLLIAELVAHVTALRAIHVDPVEERQKAA